MKAFNNVVLYNIMGSSSLIVLFYKSLFVESGWLILEEFDVSVFFSLHCIISTSGNKKIIFKNKYEDCLTSFIFLENTLIASE